MSVFDFAARGSRIRIGFVVPRLTVALAFGISKVCRGV
jgi:hypothetical protein